MLTQRNGYALLETTPNGSNGFKDLWDDHKNLGFARLHMSLSKMMELGLITAEEYTDVKSKTHPLIFAQEFECEFVTFQGRVYDEFDERLHVDPEMAPPKDWQRVVGAIDWGFHPSATAILFAYVEDGVVHIFDEVYEHKQLIEETHRSIDARVLNWSIKNMAMVADHEEDRIEELVRRGIACTKANKVNVLGARLQIKEMLWSNRIKIHPRCKFLIKDLLAATWHDKKEGELDSGQCTWGHFDAESALRYLVRELSGAEAEEPDINPHRAIDDASSRDWMLRRDLA